MPGWAEGGDPAAGTPWDFNPPMERHPVVPASTCGRGQGRLRPCLIANGLDGDPITGPLRIVSNGLGGTIAGRVRIDRARWPLGGGGGLMMSPCRRIATRESQRP